MDIGLQIWYTEYVGVQLGTAFGGSHFLCTPNFYIQYAKVDATHFSVTAKVEISDQFRAYMDRIR